MIRKSLLLFCLFVACQCVYAQRTHSLELKFYGGSTIPHRSGMGSLLHTTAGGELNYYFSTRSDDFYDVKGFHNAELNTLTNDNDKDNLVKIPQSIERKLDILLDSIKQSNLTPKQQAIVLNKIIEELDYDNIPNQWKKELINDLK